MWRLIAMSIALVGCNSLLGIHELAPDAPPDADPCTGVCECRVDTDCSGDHTVCLDQITSRTCVCAAGYTMGAAGCTWSGVVADPGLDDPTKWTVDSFASINATPMGPGQLDPGEAIEHLDPTCTMIGNASQQVTMPRLSRAQPLVLATNFQVSIPVGQQIEPVFSVGALWFDDFAQTPMWLSTRRCLGAGQYAPESTTGLGGPLTVASSFLTACVDPSTPALYVDHVEIEPATANECPPAGTALNGDLTRQTSCSCSLRWARA